MSKHAKPRTAYAILSRADIERLAKIESLDAQKGNNIRSNTICVYFKLVKDQDGELQADIRWEKTDIDWIAEVNWMKRGIRDESAIDIQPR